jgi:hypothetical protein
MDISINFSTDTEGWAFAFISENIGFSIILTWTWTPRASICHTSIIVSALHSPVLSCLPFYNINRRRINIRSW